MNSTAEVLDEQHEQQRVLHILIVNLCRGGAREISFFASFEPRDREPEKNNSGAVDFSRCGFRSSKAISDEFKFRARVIRHGVSTAILQLCGHSQVCAL